MATILKSNKAAFSAKVTGVRAAPARRALVCRAEEEKAVAKTERPADKPIYKYASSESSLAYLDGSRPGDYGFDPLGLLDPVNTNGFIEPKWLQYSEVIHCRFAMLGAAGCIAPEILGKAGVIPAETGLVWWKSGVIAPAGSGEYWADPWTLFFIEVIAMQFAELRRWQDFRNPGSMGKQYFLGLERIFQGSGDAAYPGGQFFNMFNLGKTPEEMNTLKKKEIENGRLAMIAMLGYGAQAVMTREGPYENLCAHLSDPSAHNILTSFANVQGAI